MRIVTRTVDDDMPDEVVAEVEKIIYDAPARFTLRQYLRAVQIRRPTRTVDPDGRQDHSSSWPLIWNAIYWCFIAIGLYKHHLPPVRASGATVWPEPQPSNPDQTRNT